MKTILMIFSLLFLFLKGLLSTEISSIKFTAGEPGSFVKIELEDNFFSKIEIDSKELFFPQNCQSSYAKKLRFQTIFWPLPENGFSIEIDIDERKESVSIFKDFQVTVNRAYPLVTPKSIEHGQKFYDQYAEMHHSRGLRFSKVPQNETMEHVYLRTMMRSGSHVMIFGFEKIMKEFTGHPYRAYRKKDKFYLSGGVKGSTNFTFLMWNHNDLDPAERKKVLRYAELVRDPIEAIDSLFHFYVTRNHKKKFEDSLFYWRVPIYSEFVKRASIVYFDCVSELILRNDTIKYVMRYEDLVKEPSETYRKFLSFVFRLPVEHSPIMNRIQKSFEGGVASYYRGNSSYVDRSEHWKKLVNKIEFEDVNVVYENSKEWLELFGYGKRWEDFIKRGLVKDTELLPFDFLYEEVNAKSMEHILMYKDKPIGFISGRNQSIGYPEKPPGLWMIGKDLEKDLEKKATKLQEEKMAIREAESIPIDEKGTGLFLMKKDLAMMYSDGSLEEEMQKISGEIKRELDESVLDEGEELEKGGMGEKTKFNEENE